MSYNNKAFVLIALAILCPLGAQTSGATAAVLGLAAIGVVVWAWLKDDRGES
jgi:hypothetical protein